MTREVWVVVELCDGLPEGLWIRRSEESAVKKAAEIAREQGFYRDPDGFWIGGHLELHIRTGELEQEAVE